MEAAIRRRETGEAAPHDPAAWLAWRRLPDAKKREKTLGELHTAFAGRLDEDHLARLIDDWRTLRGEAPEGDPLERVDETDLFDAARKTLGIDPTGDPPPEAVARLDGFETDLRDRVLRFQRREGRVATFEEMDALAGRVVPAALPVSGADRGDRATVTLSGGAPALVGPTEPGGAPREDTAERTWERAAVPRLIGEGLGDEWRDWRKGEAAALSPDELRERVPDLPENATADDYLAAFDALTPRETIVDNSDLYQDIDAMLQHAPGAIRSDWFALASDVTDWNALAASDLPLGEDVDPSAKAYLDYVHHNLVPENLQVGRTLLRGEEVPGLEGLRGLELDKALVAREQQLVEALSEQYFKENPHLARQQVLRAVSESTVEGATFVVPIVGVKPGYDGVEQAMRDLFPKGDYDAGNIEHRVRLGNHMMERLHALRHGDSA